jgi:hypothetical protein
MKPEWLSTIADAPSSAPVRPALLALRDAAALRAGLAKVAA